ncbi:bifunctional metallophosphatase/5'-nucleotidase [Candidatus Dependentiae bacterium]|nr:bifunctional metallophosphatase/5'-nucleotidase [Candidatus Dependentiae bacterium]
MKFKLKSFVFPTLLFLLILISVNVFAGTGKLIILHTNDIHGGISASGAWWMNPAFPPPLGGAASAVTIIKQVRAEAEKKGYELLILDAGDIWQGTPVGDKTEGRAILKFFELGGFDARTLGNHDFDAGWEVAKNTTEATDIPLVCCNVIDETTGNLPEWKNLSAYIIVEKGGLKIGIVGGITDDMESLLPGNKLGPIKFPKIGLTLPKYIKEMKEKDADIIIGLFHTGISFSKEAKYKILMEWEKEADEKGLVHGTDEYTNFIYEKKGFGLQDQEIADLVPGLDIIVGGHSHSGLYPPWEDPRNHTIVVQAYSKLSSLGQLEINYDEDTKNIVGYHAFNYTLLTEEIEPDKETDEIIGKMVKEAEAGMNVAIAHSKKPLTRGNDETLLGNLITDAIRENFNLDVVLFNRGGMRADLPIGDLTEMDIYKVLPFGNSVVTMKVSGHMLKEILEVGFSGRRRDTQLSGVTAKYNPTFPEKERICDLLINGKPLDLDATYTFATSDYLARGAVGYYMFPRIEEKDYTGVTVRETLLEYVKKHSPVEIDLEGRIRRDDTAQYSEEMKTMNAEIKTRELKLGDSEPDVDYR